LSYGYYEGIWEQPVNSRYYDVIKKAYREDLFSAFREQMRNRLILSLNFQLHRMDQYSPTFNTLLNELKSLETGEPILLKDLYSGANYAFLEDRYPSFEIEYERAQKGIGTKSPSDIFQTHMNDCQNNAAELNNLAWGIYEERYSESIDKGIELIRRAIELNPIYRYYDTYASLLFKKGDLNEASRIATYAIDLAKANNKDYTDTQKLLTKIELALKN
jgi:hypothetical protein